MLVPGKEQEPSNQSRGNQRSPKADGRGGRGIGVTRRSPVYNKTRCWQIHNRRGLKIDSKFLFKPWSGTHLL